MSGRLGFFLLVLYFFFVFFFVFFLSASLSASLSPSLSLHWLSSSEVAGIADVAAPVALGTQALLTASMAAAAVSHTRCCTRTTLPSACLSVGASGCVATTACTSGLAVVWPEEMYLLLEAATSVCTDVRTSAPQNLHNEVR